MIEIEQTLSASRYYLYEILDYGVIGSSQISVDHES